MLLGLSIVYSYYCVVFHCVDIPGFVYPFTYGWISGLHQASTIMDKALLNTLVQVIVAKCIYFFQV